MQCNSGHALFQWPLFPFMLYVGIVKTCSIKEANQLQDESQYNLIKNRLCKLFYENELLKKKTEQKQCI